VRQLLSEASLLHRKGELREASVLCDEVLRIDPENFHALHLTGIILCQSKQYQQALGYLERALALAPDHAQAWSNRGLALMESGRLDDAIRSCEKAVELSPDYPEAWYNLGNGSRLKGRLEKAIACYDKAIAVRPGYASALTNRGNVLLELGMLERALESFNNAIACDRQLPEAYANRGNALLELRHYEAAIESYDMAIAIRPDNAVAWYNRGRSLHEIRRLDTAVESYDRATAIRPDYAPAHYNKSLALLLAGNFREGLPLYEWRWGMPKFAPFKRRFNEPAWLGTGDLSGKTVLLHYEQGLGDTIQFCRFAKTVSETGADVILQVQPPLVSLLQGLPGVTELVAEGKPLPPFDAHCPLMSLPLACLTSGRTIPVTNRYLESDPEKMVRWSDRIGPKTKKARIGIAWSGSRWPKHRIERSIPLSELVRRLPREFQYTSLQKEIRKEDEAALASAGFIDHHGDELADFSDTAALCELMDLVISIDTGVAHLSAALGKETWIMLPYLPDWRWRLDGNRSPWYPTVTLFRQQEPERWEPVVAEIVSSLGQLAFADGSAGNAS
jgi:tetratricopeptide (TPR) repeat protein